MRGHPWLAALTLMLCSSLAWAVDDHAKSDVRGVIDRQIDAFRRDDGDAAYALAAPTIQGMFGDQDRFMAMVREGYGPVYRPRSYGFGEIREEGEVLEQAVDLQDEAGTDWIAVYTLERQADGAWRIAGCRIVKKPGDAV